VAWGESHPQGLIEVAGRPIVLFILKHPFSNSG
jgi:hypothetical protein